MKKKWIITSAIFLLLMFSFYGILKYRQYQSYQNSIHENADLIFKLNTDQALKVVIADFFSNPVYYLSSRCKSKSAAPDRGNGLKVPANIFVYNISGRQPTTFYCILPISDVNKLKYFLSNTLGLDTIMESGGLHYGSGSNGKISVCFNGKRIAAAYSMTGEQVKDVLKNMVAESHMLNTASEKVKTLKSNGAVLSWLQGTGEGSVEFRDGEVIAEGKISIGGLNIPDHPVRRSGFPENAALKGWLNADLRLLLKNKTFSWKENHLSGDSILKHYHNYMDFYINGMSVQEEAVVAYEYDDNFEKVATRSIKNVKVPNLNLSIAAARQPLTTYLSKSGLLQDGQLTPEAFPLFKLYFNPGNAALMEISTLRKPTINVKNESSPDFFFLNFDFSKWKKMNYLSLPAAVPGSLITLKAQATKTGKHQAKLKITLKLSEKDVNAITQIIDSNPCK